MSTYLLDNTRIWIWYSHYHCCIHKLIYVSHTSANGRKSLMNPFWIRGRIVLHRDYSLWKERTKNYIYILLHNIQLSVVHITWLSFFVGQYIFLENGIHRHSTHTLYLHSSTPSNDSTHSLYINITTMFNALPFPILFFRVGIKYTHGGLFHIPFFLY